MPDFRAMEVDQLQVLFRVLAEAGYQLVAPVLEQGAITYQEVESPTDLPQGYVDEQSGGHYRIQKSPVGDGNDRALFRYTLGPHSWKRFLFPARQQLWHARRNGQGFQITSPETDAPKYAFIGVRACELAAIRIQDGVFNQGDFTDRGYRSRREAVFLIAVNCTRAVDTCFCDSMGTGPGVSGGYDLALTELVDERRHRFVVSVGSAKGEAMLSCLDTRSAAAAEAEEARELVARTSADMRRRMSPDAAEVLRRNPEHPRWAEVAERCLSCANCTLVCPTCFCSTTEDSTSLDGSEAERWRRWDSCFNIDFSYIHGGPIRYQGAARYRQWITHKLGTWYEQFGTSGCTGCGRCITWCPVGIDITEEVDAIRAAGAALAGDA